MESDQRKYTKDPSSLSLSRNDNQWLCQRLIAFIFLCSVIIGTITPREDIRSTTVEAIPWNVTQDTRTGKRILYIVTTSMEYNTGVRARLQGKDRLIGIVLPVIRESVESMVAKGYVVDVFLVVSYILTEQRRKIIERLLPNGTGLEVWCDAAPYDYDLSGRSRYSPPKDHINIINRALARQHRYVVKDKLFFYDIFAAFEDDMKITGDHVDYYLDVTAELDRLKQEAPDVLPILSKIDHTRDHFFGPMTKLQLKRFKPGFMRVEVLKDEITFLQKASPEIFPTDFDFTDMGLNASSTSLDPSICCHTHHVGRDEISKTPDAMQLVVWESSIQGFMLREMPPSSPLGWVALLGGPSEEYKNELSGKYTHRDTHKTRYSDPRLISQSAGWMMTRQEILEHHNNLCKGGFLPPFDKPHFQHDGLYLNNVEYWSGGLQMWCWRDGCNIQRIISLHPANFSKHLLYHTANNKQVGVRQPRLVKANTLLGQLNSYRKNAIADKLKIKGGK